MAIGRIPEPGTGIPESIIAAKGDLLTGTANDTPAVLTVGANGTTLVADSSEATGLKWDTPAAGGGMTLLSTNTFANTSTSHTISGIDGNYKHLLFIGKGFRTQGNDTNISFRFNSDTGSVYYWSRWLNKETTFTATVGNAQSSLTSFVFCNNDPGIPEAANFAMWVYRYTDTDNVSGQIYGRGSAVVSAVGVRTNNSSYFTYDCSAAITSITLFSTDNITGTLYIYGVS